MLLVWRSSVNWTITPVQYTCLSKVLSLTFLGRQWVLASKMTRTKKYTHSWLKVYGWWVVGGEWWPPRLYCQLPRSAIAISISRPRSLTIDTISVWVCHSLKISDPLQFMVFPWGNSMSSDNGQCIEYLLKKVRIRGKFNVFLTTCVMAWSCLDVVSLEVIWQLNNYTCPVHLSITPVH